jgi:hypothetical protein
VYAAFRSGFVLGYAPIQNIAVGGHAEMLQILTPRYPRGGFGNGYQPRLRHSCRWGRSAPRVLS